MRTDRLETSGIALLGASIVLLSVAWIAAVSAEPTTLSDERVEAARVIEIAIQARAAGRPEQADVLLTSLVARASSPGQTHGNAPDRTHLADNPYASLAWAPTAGAVCGAFGLIAVAEAARRRRAAVNLIATELGQTNHGNDPRALVGGLARLRAERATAQLQLQKAIARLDVAESPLPVPVRESCAAGPRPDESNDAAPRHLDTYGRILEITPIESDRSG